MLGRIETGYFGRAAEYREGRYVRQAITRIHVVVNRAPVCGYKPDDTLDFYFVAGGVHWEYLTCGHCRERILRQQQATVKRLERELERSCSVGMEPVGYAELTFPFWGDL